MASPLFIFMLEGCNLSGRVVVTCCVDWSGRWDSNPRLSAWEADVLPLNYSRYLWIIRYGVFESKWE